MADEAAEKALGQALGRIASGVFILSAGKSGDESAILASWVQQCSFRPPMVMFACQSSRPIASLLGVGEPFAVSILAAEQTDVVARFGRGFPPGQNPFAGVSIERPAEGPAVLSESLAFLIGEVTAKVSAGDHDVYLGTIAAGRLLAEGQPMTHIRKNGFHY